MLEHIGTLPESVAIAMGKVIRKTLDEYAPGNGPTMKQLYLTNINDALKRNPAAIAGALFYYFRDDCADAMNYLAIPDKPIPIPMPSDFSAHSSPSS